MAGGVGTFDCVVRNNTSIKKKSYWNIVLYFYLIFFFDVEKYGFFFTFDNTRTKSNSKVTKLKKWVTKVNHDNIFDGSRNIVYTTNEFSIRVEEELLIIICSKTIHIKNEFQL